MSAPSDPNNPPDCQKGHGPEHQFKATDRSRTKGWRWMCRKCLIERKRRMYTLNREREAERAKRWQRENAEQVATNNRKQNIAKKDRRMALVAAERVMRGDICEVCGKGDGLHWHHRDPATKVATIARMKSEGYSLDMLEAELGKCALLCHDCHWEAHRRLRALKR